MNLLQLEKKSMTGPLPRLLCQYTHDHAILDYTRTREDSFSGEAASACALTNIFYLYQ